MAVFTNIDIKRRRELLRMTAATLAEMIGRDPTTIYNWESGKSDPDPDTMYQIAEAFGDLHIWYSWMRTKYSSYARLHPDYTEANIASDIMSIYAEIGDLFDLQREAMRDVADGRFDNKELEARVAKEAEDVLTACQRFLNTIKSSKARTNNRG